MHQKMILDKKMLYSLISVSEKQKPLQSRLWLLKIMVDILAVMHTFNLQLPLKEYPNRTQLDNSVC